MLPKSLFHYLLITVMFPFVLSAQSGGYMGKNFVVGYGFHTSPALIGSTPKNKHLFSTQGSAESGKIAFNSLHELFFDKVLSSRWTMGASIRIFNTRYDNSARLNGSYGDQPANYYKIRGTTLGLVFKHYRARYVAPWGRYFMIAPVLTLVKTTHDPYMHVRQSVNGHDTLISNYGDPTQRFFSLDLMMGWGKSRIFNDRIVLDYGINFYTGALAYEFGSIAYAFLDGGYLQNPTLYPISYIEGTQKIRVRGINAFNAFCRIAYLF